MSNILPTKNVDLSLLLLDWKAVGGVFYLRTHRAWHGKIMQHRIMRAERRIFPYEGGDKGPGRRIRYPGPGRVASAHYADRRVAPPPPGRPITKLYKENHRGHAHGGVPGRELFLRITIKPRAALPCWSAGERRNQLFTGRFYRSPLAVWLPSALERTKGLLFSQYMATWRTKYVGVDSGVQRPSVGQNIIYRAGDRFKLSRQAAASKRWLLSLESHLAMRRHPVTRFGLAGWRIGQDVYVGLSMSVGGGFQGGKEGQRWARRQSVAMAYRWHAQ